MMTRDEVMRYIHSDWRRAHVDVRPLGDPSGLLRMTTITLGCRVMITFLTPEEYRMGFWENLVYSGYYKDWDVLFDTLEQYLQMPMEKWRNYTENPLLIEDMTFADIHSAQIFDKVHQRQFALPSGTTYTLPSVYWRQIENHGDFDLEREFAETDESEG